MYEFDATPFRVFQITNVHDLAMDHVPLLRLPEYRRKEIVIISTNDIHGRIEQFPKLATFVKRIKEEQPECDSGRCRRSIHWQPICGPCEKKKASPSSR